VIQKEGAWSEDLYQGELELTIHFSLIRPKTPQVKSISEKWKLLQELHQQHTSRFVTRHKLKKILKRIRMDEIEEL